MEFCKKLNSFYILDKNETLIFVYDISIEANKNVIETYRIWSLIDCTQNPFCGRRLIMFELL